MLPERHSSELQQKGQSPPKVFFAKVMWLTGKSLVAVGELDLSHLK